MKARDTEVALQLFEAIKGDWALTDENDTDSFMVLVNMDRDKREDLKPPKTLISQLEAEGFIEMDIERSNSRGSQREVLDFLGESTPIPLVYLYKITEKGMKFIAEHRVP